MLVYYSFIVDQAAFSFLSLFVSFQLFLCRSYGEVNCTISNKEQASQSLIKIINHQSNLLLPLATTELSQSLPPPQWLFSKRLRTDFVQKRPAGAGTNLYCRPLRLRLACKGFLPTVCFREGFFWLFRLLKPVTLMKPPRPHPLGLFLQRLPTSPHSRTVTFCSQVCWFTSWPILSMASFTGCLQTGMVAGDLTCPTQVACLSRKFPDLLNWTLIRS